MRVFSARMKKRCAFALVLLCLVVARPETARAQCETPGLAAAAAGAFAAAQAAAVTAMTTAINAAVEAERMAANAAIGTAMNKGSDAIFDRLNRFWVDWLRAMKDQTAQIHAGQVDQTRQLAQNFDYSSIGETARRVQKVEYKAKKQYIVSEEACRFDTTAKYMSRNMQLGKAVATSFSTQFNVLGNNTAGTPAHNGYASMQQDRWSKYVTKFCDPTQNAGTIPCAATPYVNAHITPSKTIFSKESINLDDPDTLEAVTQLGFNITGYKVPDPIPVAVQKSASGREQRQMNRENLTQMDAVGALYWSVVGERSVGEKAAEIQQIRQRAGIADASEKPSDREIRQKIVEELWDPRYYVQLGDASGTVGQKEIYLKAYSLVLLYKMIEKSEKIANVYAIQTANMLDAHDRSRHGSTATRTVK